VIKLIDKREIPSKVNLPKRFWHEHEFNELERNEYRRRYLLSLTISGEEFNELLKQTLHPYLKSLGFKGAKNNYRKHDSPIIQTINLFKDKWGGQTAVNIGVHLDFVPALGTGEILSPAKFTQSHCFIQKNITLPNGKAWFDFGINTKEAEETIDFIIEAIEGQALPFLDNFNKFPEPFINISVDDLHKNNQVLENLYIGFKSIFDLQVLVAIQNKHQNFDRAKEILKYIDKIIDKDYKKRIQPILARLLNGDTNLCYLEGEVKQPISIEKEQTFWTKLFKR
jgi:hypothetical protein